ncbi:MAG: YdcH family protein [Burkholderiaceae bacterium]|nr:hypothetical protein NCPCFENI_00618 [Cupriavidus sp.]
MNPDTNIRTAHMRLLELEEEHRELDQLIMTLQQNGTGDELALRRLKKRKLQIKDQITQLIMALSPNEPA